MVPLLLPPADLVELARVGEPFGLAGLVAVLPSSSSPDVLLRARQWWLVVGVGADPQCFQVLSCKPQGKKLLVHFAGFENRDVVASLKGAQVFVSRARFPRLEGDEYYWVDLLGCQVSNPDGVCFGTVDNIVDHGAHPILEVGKQLIPFVAAYVLQVDLDKRSILVDWQEDYLQ